MRTWLHRRHLVLEITLRFCTHLPKPLVAPNDAVQEVAGPDAGFARRLLYGKGWQGTCALSFPECKHAVNLLVNTAPSWQAMLQGPTLVGSLTAPDPHVPQPVFRYIQSAQGSSSINEPCMNGHPPTLQQQFVFMRPSHPQLQSNPAAHVVWPSPTWPLRFQSHAPCFPAVHTMRPQVQ